MRKLLGRANSSNVMKAVWLMEELGLPYGRTDVGGPFGGTGTPEYRALNPNGVVPTLVEDDFVLWESNAVIRYLCAANAPGNPMWPDDLRARASIDRWMDWQQTTLNRPQSTVFQGLVRTAPERRDRGRHHRRHGRGRAVLDVARRHPGESPLRRRPGVHAGGHCARRARAPLVLLRLGPAAAAASAEVV